MQIHDVKSEDANSFLIIMTIINNYKDIFLQSYKYSTREVANEQFLCLGGIT